jgi:hypothetical protein
MEIFLFFCFIFILEFENLVIYIYLYLWFRFSMKGVLLWCLMGVSVNKKIIQFFFCLVIDIYDFFLHMVHEKNVKIQIQTTRCQYFWNN